MVKALRDHVERMVVDLSDVLARLRRRLRWAMAPITRLGALREKQGPLGPIDDALFKRCDRVIREAQGNDDADASRR
jgi:hypothetical protein